MLIKNPTKRNLKCLIFCQKLNRRVILVPNSDDAALNYSNGILSMMAAVLDGNSFVKI